MNWLIRGYSHSGPSQKELNERARRSFITRRNTRWHGQRWAR